MPDRRFTSPARFFLLFLHNLFYEGSHCLGSLVLLLPSSVGVGAEGEAGVIVCQHGGNRFDVHAVLESQGGEGVPEIVEPDVRKSGILEDPLVERD